MLPAPLCEFRAAEWPPADGECLGIYTCRANGYESNCAPQPGEPCGWRFYAGRGEDDVARRQRSTDALIRFRQARLSWLARAVGEDHPLWMDEFCRSLQDV